MSLRTKILVMGAAAAAVGIAGQRATMVIQDELSSYPTAPPRYPHYCPTCGTKETTRERYPLIRYVDVD